MSQAPGKDVTIDFLNNSKGDPFAVRFTSIYDDVSYKALIGRVYDKK
jgi:hypothetical protein